MIDIASSPNYDKIVNFLYEDNDLISKLLIDNYQEYLTHIKSKRSKKEIDELLNCYTEKTEFYKKVQTYFNLEENHELLDSYDKVIRKLRNVYKEYQEEKFRIMKNARWL